MKLDVNDNVLIEKVIQAQSMRIDTWRIYTSLNHKLVECHISHRYELSLNSNEIILIINAIDKQLQYVGQHIPNGEDSYFVDDYDLNTIKEYIRLKTMKSKFNDYLCRNDNSIDIMTFENNMEVSEIMKLVNSYIEPELYGYVDGPFPDDTKYHAIDDWNTHMIHPQRLYVAATRKDFYHAMHKDFKGHYFFDEATLKECCKNNSYEFDAKRLAEITQVSPHKGQIYSDGTYRKSILCFELKESMQAIGSICSANDIFGCGGAYQIYLDDVEELQKEGILYFNEAESRKYSDMGYNHILSDEAYEEINNRFKSRLLHLNHDLSFSV